MISTFMGLKLTVLSKEPSYSETSFHGDDGHIEFSVKVMEEDKGEKKKEMEAAAGVKLSHRAA